MAEPETETKMEDTAVVRASYTYRSEKTPKHVFLSKTVRELLWLVQVKKHFRKFFKFYTEHQMLEDGLLSFLNVRVVRWSHLYFKPVHSPDLIIKGTQGT